METGLPDSQWIAGRVGEWRLYEAVGLEEGTPAALVLVRLAELRHRHPDAGPYLDTVQEWLVARSQDYTALAEHVRQALAELHYRYGPNLGDCLAVEDEDLAAIIREAARDSGDIRAAILVRADRRAGGLPELNASERERRWARVEAISHPMVPPCPECNGTSWVACPACGGSGKTSGSVDPGAVASRMGGDARLATMVREEMRKQHIPSWVKPEEFVRLFQVTGSSGKPCMTCDGSGRRPCPRSRTLVFPLPPECRPGWVLKSNELKDGRPSFVRVRFR
jgi:hypothetical protein